jgi:hypothetical protein
MTNNSRLGRRRSQRVSLIIPISVSEPQSNDRVNREHTHTLGVNRYGGLIALRCSVSCGQSLLMTHSISRVSKECRVVWLGPHHQDKRQVGVEFVDPDNNFWNISFPPPGSKPFLD